MLIQTILKNTKIKMNVCRLKYLNFVYRPSLFPYYADLSMAQLSMACNQKIK